MRITKENLKLNTCCSHATLGYNGLRISSCHHLYFSFYQISAKFRINRCFKNKCLFEFGDNRGAQLLTMLIAAQKFAVNLAAPVSFQFKT